MKEWIFRIVVIALLLVSIGISLSNRNDMQQVAVVRSAEVIDQYMGVKEANHQYQEQLNSWQQELDTLQKVIESRVAEYQQLAESLSEQERMQHETELQRLVTQSQQYKQSIEQKAAEQNDELLQGALNQINEFVAQYAEANNYDVVLGTTAGGNVLYGAEYVDITNEIIEGLNASYIQ